MGHPRVIKLQKAELESLRTSLERKPLKYMDLLQLIEQKLPCEVYVNRLEFPDNNMTVTSGKFDRVVQIESSSSSWVEAALEFVGAGEPIQWVLTDRQVTPVR